MTLHPHVQAILLAFAATGAAGALLLLLLLAARRRRAQGRPVPRAWPVAGVLVAVVAACGAYLSLVFVGMTFNGGSYERLVVEAGGFPRKIERRDMWGRVGMCLVLDEQRKLDLVETGLYSGDRKEAPIAFEEDGVGFRGPDGRCGPWLYFGPDGQPDAGRTGWYRKDELIQPAPAGRGRELIQEEIDDLQLAWESR